MYFERILLIKFFNSLVDILFAEGGVGQIFSPKNRSGTYHTFVYSSTQKIFLNRATYSKEEMKADFWVGGVF